MTEVCQGEPAIIRESSDAHSSRAGPQGTPQGGIQFVAALPRPVPNLPRPYLKTKTQCPYLL